MTPVSFVVVCCTVFALSSAISICPPRALFQTRPWPSKRPVRRFDNHESLRPEMLATGVRPKTSPLDTCSGPLSLANFLLLNFPQLWLPAVPDRSAAAFSTYRQHRSAPGLRSPLVRSAPAPPLCLFRLVDAS